MWEAKFGLSVPGPCARLSIANWVDSRTQPEPTLLGTGEIASGLVGSPSARRRLGRARGTGFPDDILPPALHLR